MAIFYLVNFTFTEKSKYLKFCTDYNIRQEDHLEAKSKILSWNTVEWYSHIALISSENIPHT